MWIILYEKGIVNHIPDDVPSSEVIGLSRQCLRDSTKLSDESLVKTVGAFHYESLPLVNKGLLQHGLRLVKQGTLEETVTKLADMLERDFTYRFMWQSALADSFKKAYEEAASKDDISAISNIAALDFISRLSSLDKSIDTSDMLS